MRRSSSTTRRCGASSGSAAGCILASRLGGTVGARDQTQHTLAIVGIDHGGEKAPRRLVRAGPEFGEGAIDAHRLQAGELKCQRLPFRRHKQQPLTAVLRAFLLHHEALVDQLLEHAAERLLGDVEDLEQVSDLHAGVAVDEMQHPVMGAPKGELGKHFVRIADEIAIGEKQQLDDVPDRLGRRGGRDRTLRQAAGRHGDLGVHIYVSHIDIFWFYVTKTSLPTKGSYRNGPFFRQCADRTAPAPFIPGVAPRRKVLELTRKMLHDRGKRERQKRPTGPSPRRKVWLRNPMTGSKGSSGTTASWCLGLTPTCMCSATACTM